MGGSHKLKADTVANQGSVREKAILGNGVVYLCFHPKDPDDATKGVCGWTWSTLSAPRSQEPPYEGSPKKARCAETGSLRKDAHPNVVKTAGNRMRIMRIKARRDPLIIHLSLTWQPSRPCSCSSLPCWPRPTLRTPLARLVGRSHRRPARPALTARRGYALPRTPAEASAQLCWIRVCNLFRFQAPVDVTQRPTRTPVVNGTDHPTRVPVVVTARPTRVLPTPRSLLHALPTSPPSPLSCFRSCLRSPHDSLCPCRSQPSSRRGPLADESRVRRARPPRRT
jgi:hypothetical protein